MRELGLRPTRWLAPQNRRGCRRFAFSQGTGSISTSWPGIAFRRAIRRHLDLQHLVRHITAAPIAKLKADGVYSLRNKSTKMRVRTSKPELTQKCNSTRFQRGIHGFAFEFPIAHLSVLIKEWRRSVSGKRRSVNGKNV